ncbi:MAG: Ig domain-containing protein [Longimicrobiaceae bacterium]
MRSSRVLSLALAAFVVSAVASCAGGDGGSPTGSDPSASSGSDTHPNGTQLVLASGGGQTGIAGQPLPGPVVVRVLDTSSKPVPGATVNFIARDGSADPAQASTDAEGHARTTWTLGSAAGPQELRVSGTGGTTLVVSAVAVAPAKVARVQVIPDSLVLAPGATGDFSAVAYDSADNVLTGRTVTWTSSDSVVATVGSTGTVTAASPGSARVTATVEGVSGSAGVRVLPPPPAKVARVEVEPDSLALQPGQAGDFNAVAYDSAGNVLTGRTIAWTISDSTVATIATGGTVTAVAPGTARVTAAVDGVGGSAMVFVFAPPPAAVARVVVTPDSVVLQPGQTVDLDVTAYDAEGHVLTGRTVGWTTSDSTVAAVGAGGLVTAVSPGSARITATVEGVGGSALAFVVAPPPAGVARVEVTPDSLVLQPGRTGDFDAAAYDAEGHVLTGRTVAWTISDSTVATIGTGGTVTAVSPGTARITATVDGVNGFAKLVVAAPPPAAVARVDLTPDSLVLQLGQTGDFTATAYDADGNVLTGRAVVWRSSDSTVAIVGAGGAVTSVGYGTARISATVEGVVGSAPVYVRAPEPARVARVKVIPDSLVLEVGHAGNFDAVAYDAEGHVLTGRAVAWTTSDSTLVRLGPYGSVAGLSAGTARVTATVEGVSGSAPVRVWVKGPPKVARVEVRPDSVGMDIGDSVEVRVFAYDSLGNYLTGRGVSFASTAAGVATVDGQGRVIAVASGQAKIVATVEGVQGYAGVWVNTRPPGTVTRVRVVPDSLILYIAESRDLIAVAYDRDGVVLTGRRVYWSSSDPQVAPVYEGNVTGVAAGFARITATVEGVSYSIRVEVRGPPPQPYPGDRAVMWIQKRVGSPAVGPDYGLIDVTDYDRSVNFWVELGHTASGIRMWVRSPSGAETQECFNPQRWNETWKEFYCVVYLPKGSEPGAWYVDRLVVDGVAYTAADLEAMRAPGRVFDVFRRGTDPSPPQLRGIWPHGWGNGRYYVEIGVVDHVTGVRSVVMIVRGPNGETASCSASAAYGDLARLGDWPCALDIPANSGTWTVVSVTTTDGAGNTVTYTPRQIEPVRDAFEYTWLTYEFFP